MTHARLLSIPDKILKRFEIIIDEDILYNSILVRVGSIKISTLKKILEKNYPQACRKMGISIILASYPQFNRMRGFFMQREKFSSRLGFILISAGCAIGLGNVWRFPYIVV